MQSVRHFASKSTKEDKPKESSATHGVYLWSKLPRLGAKSGSVTTNLQMPKGMPQRIEEYDALNV